MGDNLWNHAINWGKKVEFEIDMPKTFFVEFSTNQPRFRLKLEDTLVPITQKHSQFQPMKIHKKTLLCSILLMICGSLMGQFDYVSYYHLVRKANQELQERNYDSASVHFSQAFSKVDYVHNANLQAAAKVEKKLHHAEMQKHYSARYRQQTKSLNNGYKHVLDSLADEDQRVRGTNYSKAIQQYANCLNDSLCDWNSPKFSRYMALVNEWKQTDSTNIAMLKSLIVQKGFPSERLVGSKTAGNTWVIILHYDRDNENLIMKPYLDSALSKGEIDPAFYAWIVDRRLNWGQGKPPYYYHMPMGLETLTEDQIKEVNAKRYDIGLPGVYEGRKIIQKKHSIKVVNTTR
jgi:hypothetical protein